MQSFRRFWALGWGAILVLFLFEMGTGGAREAWGRTVATTRVATTRVAKLRGMAESPVASSLTQVLWRLNRHGRRYGRCGRDRWHGAVGEQGVLRLKRSYQATTSDLGLAERGRATHRCAVLRARKRFDQVTVEVNAHDLGMVDVSFLEGGGGDEGPGVYDAFVGGGVIDDFEGPGAGQG